MKKLTSDENQAIFFIKLQNCVMRVDKKVIPLKWKARNFKISVSNLMGGEKLVQSNTQNVGMSSNEKLRRELKRVREENRKLKNIISYGNISTLSTLVDQYMDYSRIHLKKIALEIQLTDYEQGSTEKVMELIEHFEYVENELYKIIAVNEEGMTAQDENLKMDLKIAREMLPKIEQILHLEIDKNKSGELATVLAEFAQKLGKYF